MVYQAAAQVNKLKSKIKLGQFIFYLFDSWKLSTISIQESSLSSPILTTLADAWSILLSLSVSSVASLIIWLRERALSGLRSWEWMLPSWLSFFSS